MSKPITLLKKMFRPLARMRHHTTSVSQRDCVMANEPVQDRQHAVKCLRSKGRASGGRDSLMSEAQFAQRDDQTLSTAISEGGVNPGQAQQAQPGSKQSATYLESNDETSGGRTYRVVQQPVWTAKRVKLHIFQEGVDRSLAPSALPHGGEVVRWATPPERAEDLDYESCMNEHRQLRPRHDLNTPKVEPEVSEAHVARAVESEPQTHRNKVEVATQDLDNGNRRFNCSPPKNTVRQRKRSIIVWSNSGPQNDLVPKVPTIKAVTQDSRETAPLITTAARVTPSDSIQTLREAHAAGCSMEAHDILIPATQSNDALQEDEKQLRAGSDRSRLHHCAPKLITEGGDIPDTAQRIDRAEQPTGNSCQVARELFSKVHDQSQAGAANRRLKATADERVLYIIERISLLNVEFSKFEAILKDIRASIGERLPTPSEASDGQKLIKRLEGINTNRMKLLEEKREWRAKVQACRDKWMNIAEEVEALEQGLYQQTPELLKPTETDLFQTHVQKEEKRRGDEGGSDTQRATTRELTPSATGLPPTDAHGIALREAYKRVSLAQIALQEAHGQYETHRISYRLTYNKFKRAQHADRPTSSIDKDFSKQFLKQGQKLMHAIGAAEAAVQAAYNEAAAAGFSIMDQDDNGDIALISDDEGITEYLRLTLDRAAIMSWMEGVPDNNGTKNAGNRKRKFSEIDADVDTTQLHVDTGDYESLTPAIDNAILSSSERAYGAKRERIDVWSLSLRGIKA